ncbi:MAG TPA: hypothetical protein VND64_06770 [Pirellulales bacterium]|nr:hypothetical protein [Pirellulales bacterium]
MDKYVIPSVKTDRPLPLSFVQVVGRALMDVEAGDPKVSERLHRVLGIDADLAVLPPRTTDAQHCHGDPVAQSPPA